MKRRIAYFPDSDVWCADTLPAGRLHLMLNRGACTPRAGAAQDAAHTPEAGIGQTAAASQPITTTGILTGVVLPAVDLPLSATGVVTWNMSAPDAAVSLPAPLLTMSADPFQIVPGGVITYSVAITNVAAPLACGVGQLVADRGLCGAERGGVQLFAATSGWPGPSSASSQDGRGSFNCATGCITAITNTVRRPARRFVVTASPEVAAATEPGGLTLARVVAALRGWRWICGACRAVAAEPRYASPAGLSYRAHLLCFDLTPARLASSDAIPAIESAVFNPFNYRRRLDRLALFHPNEQSGGGSYAQPDRPAPAAVTPQWSISAPMAWA